MQRVAKGGVEVIWIPEVVLFVGKRAARKDYKIEEEAFLQKTEGVEGGEAGKKSLDFVCLSWLLLYHSIVG